MRTYKILLLVTGLLSISTLHAQTMDADSRRKHAIDSLALEKIRDLSKYIRIIGNKNTAFSEAERVVSRASELFAPGSRIGVSSAASKQIRYYQVKKYFERLMLLNYNRVSIEWYSIQYISNLERQPDGRYVGVITIYQKFQGYSSEGLKYTDVTKKDITVLVEHKETQIRGRLVGFWDVLLGDIRVTGTSRDK